MPEIGVTLHCKQEQNNNEDPYTVSMMKDDIIPYHIKTNIGGYNIWRYVEIMDLVRY